MKAFLLSCGLLAATIFSSAQTSTQSWVELMHKPNANLYQVQHAFNNYWQSRDITEKGKGYKAFKRWENFVSPRVYPSGNVGLISQNAKNYADFLAAYQAQNVNQNVGGRNGGGGNLIASATWTAMGPFGALTGSAGGQLNKNGRMCFITIHPTNTLSLYAGTGAGGLWHSIDGGTTWTTNTDNLGVLGCSDLAIDPITPTTMYLATGDGDAGDTQSIGVLKSTDGGATWLATGLVFPVANGYLIRRLIINPTNTQILLAATNAGIYRTTNGGTSWAVVQANDTYDLEFQPGNPTVVYAGGASFRRSADGGATWTQITNGIPNTGVYRMAIAVTPADVNRVYVLAGNTTDNGMLGVYKSINAGLAFTTISPGGGVNLLGWNSNGLDLGGQDWYDLCIAASPLNANEVVTGGVNIWRTTDAGTTWGIYGHWTGTGAPFIHADHHDLEYDVNGLLYGTNDGTVYKRTGGTWTEICGTINISQIYKVGTSALTANKWITGHQDNGTNIWTGATYTCSIGGDGMDCFIDRTNDNNMFGETYSGSFRRSTNGGANWAAYTTGMSGTAPWVSIWKQDPQTAGVIYGAYSNLFKSVLANGTWTSLAALPAAGTINEFAVAPSNSLTIYVLKNAGIYKTINGGTSWTTITGTVPVGSGAPTFITICPTDPNKAWVTLSGYSAGNKVFRTTDGGTTWTNFTGNLPNLPANCSVYQPGTSDRIYVGMDVGVYYRDNVAASWTLYNTGLPNAPLSDMEISPADPTKLIAATYGRGMWKVDLIANLAPVSSFTYAGNPCTGNALLFTDVSVNGPTSWSWSVTPAPGVTINTPASQNPTITFANAGTYTVSLLSSNGVGPGTVSNQTLTIIATPTITATNSVQTICSGTSASITAAGATSYTWSNGALTSTVSISPSITTVYTVTGSTGACLSAPKTATVNVAASPTVAVNSTSICIGSNTLITASGATSYSWSTGALTNTISVSPTVTTVYTVTGTSAGCTNVNTATVNVMATPTVAVTNSVQTICAGSPANITASGAATYSWSTGANTSTVSVSPTVTTVYTVTGNNGSCANVKTATVNVNPSPTVSVNNATICGGATILTASGAASYSWSNGALTNTVSVSPTVTTVYTITGTSGGCTDVKTSTVTVNGLTVVVTNSVQTLCGGASTVITASGATTYSWSTGALTNTISISPTVTTVYTVTGTTGGCTNTKTFTITVGGSPTVVISNSVQTICSGASLNINSSGATTYLWNTGATTSVISVSPLVTTVYTVTGFNGGCSDVKTATVVVNALPVVNAAADQTVICEGGFVTLTGSGANTYTWQPGNLNGPVVTDNPLSTQLYTVTATDANGCTGTQTILITVAVCTGKLQNGAESVIFSVFPNPASENITVHYPSGVTSELTIEVLDAAGKLIIRKTQAFSKHNPDLNMNISTVAKGTYFLKLIPKEGASKTVKLVKD